MSEASIANDNAAPSKANGLLRRAGLPILCFVLGAGAALGTERLLSVALGDPTETRVLTYQDWRVICSPGVPATPATETTPGVAAIPPGCRLVQDVVRPEGGALLQLAVIQDDGGNLVVTVPHGVVLDAGLGFAVGAGATPVVHQYAACLDSGCLAPVALDEATLKLLRENTEGRVTVMPGTGQPVAIPFSLRGFADGYAALARQNSWF